MDLCFNSLVNSVNKREFKKRLQQLISVVYHECDHLKFPARVISEKGLESRIWYMIDSAEVRAYRKQIGYLYFQVFPCKRFNYKNLKRYILQRYNLQDQEFQIIQLLDFFKDPRNPSFTQKESRICLWYC